MLLSLLRSIQKGHISFGSVVAVLIATMGDAAFLLLSKEPYSAMIVISLGIVSGSISGWVVDYIHGQDYLRTSPCESVYSDEKKEFKQDPLNFYLSILFMFFFIPGLLFGILLAMQLDVDSFLFSRPNENITQSFGTLGGLLCLLMWILGKPPLSQISAEPYKASTSFIIFRTIRDTIFVTNWVVLGFVAFELTMYVTGANLEKLDGKLDAPTSTTSNNDWFYTRMWATNNHNIAIFSWSHPIFQLR